MKNLLYILAALILLSIAYTPLKSMNRLDNPKPVVQKNEYTIVIEGYDWGPAVSKVILPIDDTSLLADKEAFSVLVARHTDCVEFPPDEQSGERTILLAYKSDANANRTLNGAFITLVLAVGPDMVLGAPMQFFYNEHCNGTQWIDYQMTIIHKPSNRIWNKEAQRISPILDQFDLSGDFHHGDVKLKYASFTPALKTNKKHPLIIWLHGGGEGGTDLTLPLLANKATNYASPEIQTIFGGAYILVPQSPTFWMQNAAGNYTTGKEDDLYNKALMALIRNYVAEHPQVDTDRIYIGGCSNGGYMSLKLLLLYPRYFAAAFPSALAYESQYITDEQIQQIKDMPIWFVHAADDQTTIPNKTVLPIYKRLMAAGAKDVHLSYYQHVTDITGLFGGENYHYNGHLSWIYCHANKCQIDFDGNPVTLNGTPVYIMNWVAAKKR